MFGNVLLIILLIGLNAFFVAVEFAAVSSRRARIFSLAEEGNQAAVLVKGWLEDHTTRDRLIAASQLGITMVSLALGAIGENTFEQLLAPYFQTLTPIAYTWLTPVLKGLPLVLALIIVTSLHVVLGEQVPKVATLYAPEKVALAFARPMQTFSGLFKWFVDILDWLTRHALVLLGVKTIPPHSLSLTVSELKLMLDESEETGVIEKPEREMLDAIFDLSELVVRQVSMPRTEFVAIEADTSLDEILTLISTNPYTKYPVYEDDLDQVIGILHVKDMLHYIHGEQPRNLTARDLAREALFVPDSIPVPALLREFRTKRQHIAIVLDEFGGTAGLVTLEDLLEEIVGEVSDPFDSDLPEMQRMPDGSFQIDGMALIEEVNKELDLELSDENYDTIAGYVLGKLGHIPSAGESVESAGLRLDVLKMDGRRIERILLKKMDPPLLKV